MIFTTIFVLSVKKAYGLSLLSSARNITFNHFTWTIKSVNSASHLSSVSSNANINQMRMSIQKENKISLKILMHLRRDLCQINDRKTHKKMVRPIISKKRELHEHQLSLCQLENKNSATLQ